MRGLFFYLFLLSAIYSNGLLAQEDRQSDALLQAGLVFDQKDFGGHFAVKAVSENDYEYYVTDLTQLITRFERIYFLNLTYADHRLVNIDPDIENSQLWFKAHYQYPESEIICQLDDFRKEALKISQTWTDSEKQSWLMKYDKFNTLKDNGK
jgi:hypothetical protein